MSFHTNFTVDQSPTQVYSAVNDVRAWWTGAITGPTDVLGSEFTYRYEDKHCSTQRVTELLPGQRVRWLVTEANLPFASDPTEWVGTQVVFEIVGVPGGTELRFTHEGLEPALDCYESCSNAWGSLITTNLRARIERPAA